MSIPRIFPYLILFIFSTLLLANPGQLKCDYCSKNISGKYVIFEDHKYHKQCYSQHIKLRCDYCKKTIDGSYNILDDKNYHPSCYIDHIVEKCGICRQPLEGQYLSDYWGNNYHTAHRNELSECSTCGRLICERLTRGGYALDDGRKICGLCNATGVTTNREINASLDFVKMLFSENGMGNFPESIPITLVDKPTLKRLSETYSDAMKGFTDQQAQTINGRIVSRESQIYILSHLPEIVFQSVLAHELLHVYLFENDHDLRSDIREGFCNLGSEMVYKSTNSEFSNFRLENMGLSKDPDYGVGYQKMSKLLHRYGWAYILDNLEDIN